jgi:hypothetical protein
MTLGTIIWTVPGVVTVVKKVFKVILTTVSKGNQIILASHN